MIGLSSEIYRDSEVKDLPSIRQPVIFYKHDKDKQ
jgi:hypothetical protein